MSRKSHKNMKYSKELKQNAIQKYLAGQGSLRAICRKYKTLDNRQLRDWNNTSFNETLQQSNRGQ